MAANQDRTQYRAAKYRARDRGKAWSEDAGRYGNGNTALKNRNAGLPLAGTAVHGPSNVIAPISAPPPTFLMLNDSIV